jgi:transcriptional regulator GlxA family with amidase domain
MSEGLSAPSEDEDRGQRSVSDALFQYGDVLLRARQHDLLHRAMMYVEQNIDAAISLQDVANAVGLQPCSLSRMCSRDLGVTFTMFVNVYRIYRATCSLADDRHAIADIAESVGFRDELAFKRTFKNITGLSPAVFRRVIEVATYRGAVNGSLGAAMLWKEGKNGR